MSTFSSYIFDGTVRFMRRAFSSYVFDDSVKFMRRGIAGSIITNFGNFAF